MGAFPVDYGNCISRLDLIPYSNTYNNTIFMGPLLGTFVPGQEGNGPYPEQQ